MRHITLQDIFSNLPDTNLTKIKFNMNNNDDMNSAYDLLMNDDKKWLQMNAHKSKSINHNLEKADYLLSFAQYRYYGTEFYIFGGFYRVCHNKKAKKENEYVLEKLPNYEQFEKRLIIKINKPIGRDVYNRRYNSAIDLLQPVVYEILPGKAMKPFTGFNSVYLSHKELQTIFYNNDINWKKQLSSVKGVYCITDTTNGQLYIGSAYGEEGIWERWQKYANIKNLTGGNKHFENIKKKEGGYIIKNFTYSILEIFDIKTKKEPIIEREQYWKNVFGTRKYGMNKN